MNEDIPLSFHPIMLLQDRYGGGYSGGQWIAIREANEMFETDSLAAWVVKNGPNGDDRDAAGFWSNPPDWIAVGASPEDAMTAV